MTYWVMKLDSGGRCAERMSACENGFDTESGDTGFSDYDEAVNFAATLAAVKGGGYVLVEVKDMFCQSEDDAEVCEDFVTPIGRVHYDDNGEQIFSVGVAIQLTDDGV